MKTFLKIKIKSLAAEARMIRQEEKKWPGPHPLRTSLHEHRVHDVRGEQRVSLLAYGFLRGRDYERLEGNTKTKPDLKKVYDIAKRFRGLMDIREFEQRWNAWKEIAEIEKAA